MILLTGIALALFVFPDGWEIPVIAGFAIAEVLETAFTWRFSRRGAPKVGVETLIGAEGRVKTACRPDGTVRVRGEIWQARCEEGADTDQRVRVVARDRLVLIIEAIV